MFLPFSLSINHLPSLLLQPFILSLILLLFFLCLLHRLFPFLLQFFPFLFQFLSLLLFLLFPSPLFFSRKKKKKK
ncbi:hypothetical protein BKA57DRAFT_455322, partial [Linnemannia elongata]